MRDDARSEPADELVGHDFHLSRRTQRGAHRSAPTAGAAPSLRAAEIEAHQKRIARIAQAIAGELGWSESQRNTLAAAAAAHDIGKLAVPRRVLWKPGPLNSFERRIVETHTVVGALLLVGKRGGWVAMARRIALYHHERWDGRGYPRGLAGEAIPSAARIVAVADVYDALTHSRVYRPAFPEEPAVAFMRAQRARHFDPTVIECFLDLLPRLRSAGPEPGHQLAAQRA